MQDDESVNWPEQLHGGHPAWQPYSEILQRLPKAALDDPSLLNRLLDEGIVTAAGHPIRFVDQDTLTAANYEQRVFNTGEVSSRARNLHDLCNALVWGRLPQCKLAINQLHMKEISQRGESAVRGPARDALTLLDESGLILISTHQPLLEALQQHDWEQAFQTLKPSWSEHCRLIVIGHAILEKLCNPFKAITAKCLLVKASESVLHQRWRALDQVLGDQLLNGNWLKQPRDLSALPIMGIPGWWTANKQDSDFYADQDVFRSPGPRWSASPVRTWPVRFP